MGSRTSLFPLDAMVKLLFHFDTIISFIPFSAVHRAFEPVKKAVEWARRTEREFPAICQRLDLGKDWDFATKKLLHIEEIGIGITVVSPPHI